MKLSDQLKNSVQGRQLFGGIPLRKTIRFVRNFRERGLNLSNMSGGIEVIDNAVLDCGCAMQSLKQPTKETYTGKIICTRCLAKCGLCGRPVCKSGLDPDGIMIGEDAWLCIPCFDEWSKQQRRLKIWTGIRDFLKGVVGRP